jgi:hypothetical protein
MAASGASMSMAMLLPRPFRAGLVVKAASARRLKLD